MVEALKKKARDEFIRITEKNLGCRFDGLNHKQRSIAMTKFYIQEIHNPTRTFISEEDQDEGLVDGRSDLGCDFIHRDDGRVLIIQSKYRKSNTSEDIQSISHFQSILQRFRNPEVEPNRRLDEALSEINWETDQFELVFITFGKLDGQARKNSLQPQMHSKSMSDIEGRCDWKFLDENDLNIELRSAHNLQRGASNKTIKLHPVGTKGARGKSVIELEAGQFRSFITALDARQVIRCYEELEKDALFSLNIRNFIGNTNTNKSIMQTAEKNPDNFFLYNNGISCLATKIETSEECITATGLQVINGAQTVKALVNLSRSKHRSESELWLNTLPKILVRITEIPEGYGPSAKIRERITQYNNTQNTIKISDFRSNDDVQTNLNKQFSETTRHGRKVSYLPKRTDRTPLNHEIIRMEEYAKCVYAFLYDPTSFSGSTSFLFNMDNDGGYIKVFGNGEKIWEQMPDEEFKIRAGIYWLSQEFTPHLRKKREEEQDPDARASLERKWMLLYATSRVLKELYRDENWKIQIKKLHKGDWHIEDDKKGKVLAKVFEIAKSAVILAYRNSKQNNPNFVHRNWMRSKQTPLEISAAVGLLLPTLASNVGEIPN